VGRQLSGFRAWLWQRGTALYLGSFLVYLLLRLLLDPPTGHLAWRSWLAHTPVWIGAALFFMALLLHAWIGIRDVILDYVHPPLLRLVVLSMALFFLLANGLWLAALLMEVK
jgi:succinate dehydrogenase / fumarate reductase membrane anchor subunit